MKMRPSEGTKGYVESHVKPGWKLSLSCLISLDPLCWITCEKKPVNYQSTLYADRKGSSAHLSVITHCQGFKQHFYQTKQLAKTWHLFHFMTVSTCGKSSQHKKESRLQTVSDQWSFTPQLCILRLISTYTYHRRLVNKWTILVMFNTRTCISSQIVGYLMETKSGSGIRVNYVQPLNNSIGSYVKPMKTVWLYNVSLSMKNQGLFEAGTRV